VLEVIENEKQLPGAQVLLEEVGKALIPLFPHGQCCRHGGGNETGVG